LPGGSGVLAGDERVRTTNSAIKSRHAELVSASIVPFSQVSKIEAASAVGPSKASAQTDGWMLNQVQNDGVYEVVG